MNSTPANLQSAQSIKSLATTAARRLLPRAFLKPTVARVEDPDKLAAALRDGLENTASPTVLDVVVTRDPAKMLPGVDNRMLTVTKGDRQV
jgi:hypothetical protein